MTEHSDAVNIALLQRDVEVLTENVKELTKKTDDLVQAWTAAGKLVGFVKWLASLVAAVGILWLFVRHGFSRQG